MKPQTYRTLWDRLRRAPTAPAPLELQHLARQVALSFLDRYLYSDRYEPEYIRVLCEMATAFADAMLNAFASDALFGIVVESLCDDFEELQTRTYNRVMSQVVAFCQSLPEGAALARRLSGFGLRTETALLTRIEALRERSDSDAHVLGQPRKVVLLSRVTVGADVAIGSVIVQRLRAARPDVEIVLLGNPGLARLFGACPRLRLVTLEYPRRGGLLDRFECWHAVLDAVAAETALAGHGRVAVIDPDSRLSQLGVLPVTDDRDYFFFNTRAWTAYPPRISMAEMTNHWMDRVLGGPGGTAYPRVWLARPVRDQARQAARMLRARGCRRLVTVNFGVGGNPRKRVGPDFEKALLLSLLQDRRTLVFLDEGAGAAEARQAARLRRAVRAQGYPVEKRRFDALADLRRRGGLVVLHAAIDEIAALIAECDEFVGYDSACQHISAALGVPTCTVFAGSNNPRFVRRWRATGPAATEVIHVDTIGRPRRFDAEDIVMRVTERNPAGGAARARRRAARAAPPQRGKPGHRSA
jgi:ADP-heptose:LPS heptosyltransferase